MNDLENNKVLSSEFLQSVSKGPGVYLMMSDEKNVLYVGKALDLRKRLASYTRFQGDKTSKTGVMLKSVKKIKTILTQTEKEALILEASLIKKYKPKYNIILRDDKNYPLLKVTLDELWPRLVVTRRRQKKDTAVFGPYSSASAMRETINYLSGIFPLRKCKGRDVKARTRPCMNYQINRCLGVCAGKASQEDYLENVNQLIMVLSGKNKELQAKLENEMITASGNLDFEKAAILRDRIKALSKTMEKQVISASHHKNQDAFGYIREGSSVAVCILRVKDGIINGHHSYFFPETLDDDKLVFAEIIERFYSEELIPKEILLPFLPDSADLISEWLSSRSESHIMKVPLRGASLKLINMAQKNAEQVFSDKKKMALSWQALALKIKNSLKLNKIPSRITCMDISHMSGDQTVGSVVNFKNGIKEKKYYRHYNIKGVTGPDDYASMSELLARHINRAADFMPDLLLVDGGKGQLNIAINILKNMGVSHRIELAGIAKEKKEEGEKIYRPGRKDSIKFSKNSSVLLLLMKIRDEAHRYGITLHRKLRNKKTLASPLDAIDGVGQARKKVLLKSLGSLKRISEASIDELTNVDGVGQELAKTIWHHFHGE